MTIIIKKQLIFISGGLEFDQNVQLNNFNNEFN